MRYTIITPTICRKTLVRLCESIDAQNQPSWEHLVAVDVPESELTADQTEMMASIPVRSNRSFFYCDKRHKNYGNTCRRKVSEHAQGDYIFYVDDDDYLADDGVLKTLDSVTQLWAVFPILRHGKVCFNLPPRIGNTGTAMFIHQREIGRWPKTDVYEADGLLVEDLRQKYPYQVLKSRPLVIMPTSSCGIANAESWTGSKLAKLRQRWLQYRYSARAGSAS
jgi:glycosyltransferase involved in cell wall biosynthesis